MMNKNKINSIIERLDEWQKRLGYNPEQGDLSDIINDLRKEILKTNTKKREK